MSEPTGLKALARENRTTKLGLNKNCIIGATKATFIINFSSAILAHFVRRLYKKIGWKCSSASKETVWKLHAINPFISQNVSLFICFCGFMPDCDRKKIFATEVSITHYVKKMILNFLSCELLFIIILIFLRSSGTRFLSWHSVAVCFTFLYQYWRISRFCAARKWLIMSLTNLVLEAEHAIDFLRFKILI